MTPPTTTASALTDSQIVERLATEVMGWKQRANMWIVKDTDDEFYSYWKSDWRPLTNWNHWRQVEEKVMEDETLWVTYIERLWSLPATLDIMKVCDEIVAIDTAAKSDLRTRCLALLSALDTLKV